MNPFDADVESIARMMCEEYGFKPDAWVVRHKEPVRGAFGHVIITEASDLVRQWTLYASFAEMAVRSAAKHGSTSNV